MCSVRKREMYFMCELCRIAHSAAHSLLLFYTGHDYRPRQKAKDGWTGVRRVYAFGKWIKAQSLINNYYFNGIHHSTTYQALRTMLNCICEQQQEREKMKWKKNVNASLLAIHLLVLHSETFQIIPICSDTHVLKRNENRKMSRFATRDEWTERAMHFDKSIEWEHRTQTYDDGIRKSSQHDSRCAQCALNVSVKLVIEKMVCYSIEKYFT